jgi:hypothetical protein
VVDPTEVRIISTTTELFRTLVAAITGHKTLSEVERYTARPWIKNGWRGRLSPG